MKESQLSVKTGQKRCRDRPRITQCIRLGGGWVGGWEHSWGGTCVPARATALLCGSSSSVYSPSKHHLRAYCVPGDWNSGYQTVSWSQHRGAGNLRTKAPRKERHTAPWHTPRAWMLWQLSRQPAPSPGHILTSQCCYPILQIRRLRLREMSSLLLDYWG